MMLNKPVRKAFGVAAAMVAAASLVACESKPVAPPEPPPAPISLSSKALEAASAWRAYMARAKTLNAEFKNGDAVADALREGMSFEPGQLQRGALAYAAVAAMQEPLYMAEVRKFAATAAQRRAVTEAIMRDPAYVVGITGSDRAAGLAVAALDAEGAEVLRRGAAIKQAAYSVQKQAWSKKPVPDRPQRLSQAKSLALTPLTPVPDDVALLRQVTLGSGGLVLSGEPLPPPYTPLIMRALAVAALAALGEGGEERTESVMPLLNEPNSAYCLNMSKLNLFQCLAVSKPHYEDVFCLGQHVVSDIGQCMVKAAGAPVPVVIAEPEPAPAPIPVKAAAVKLKSTPKKK